MKKIYSLIILAFLAACDDGDIAVAEIDFSDSDVELCGEYLYYMLGDNNTESLTLYISSNNNIPYLDGSVDYTINNSTNTLIYRVYDGDATDYFCNDIQPASPNVISEWTVLDGDVNITTTLEYDDEDGIDFEDEEPGSMDSNGEYPDALDTDGDGIPNYMDEDDDGDNVPTIDEIDFDDDDNPILTDTDGDGIPDYLDNDDDNDGILTINESIDGDLNPANDVQAGNDLANYLLVEEQESLEATEFIEHTYYITFTNDITPDPNISFVNDNGTELRLDNFDFGSYDFTETIELTPDFVE
ncbi:hypothetical protein SAMN05216480_101837 [Pustulibacterium marinum]|uniref:Uncharacterized protein n=1 Tax=Pustulibacterium marinum TaxID=1224947 RepID=A0A1I7FCB4_9FLAO|nr:hypothetical protein [Pustulibacterium marinum]SFU33706.1 hypothetical protein SAMN05216480_101837 [Pustulibacterium marinum]